ncbi:hypothetical protein L3Q82_008845 [Scortum barcoo]|uniref:Uncharacterized protein n=1 Tax=Scortum barcoo TaxID=214431 RepID=A0ACB8XC58_9TELE|nr:hypothetical protein L3Q82_008845 [Scortum barcoo]
MDSRIRCSFYILTGCIPVLVQQLHRPQPLKNYPSATTLVQERRQQERLHVGSRVLADVGATLAYSWFPSN